MIQYEIGHHNTKTLLFNTSTALISKVGSMLKWLLHWIYCVINVYIPHLQAHFTYINIYQVFLSAAKAIAMLNTNCSIARVRNRSRMNMQNFFFFLFFLLVNIFILR